MNKLKAGIRGFVLLIGLLLAFSTKGVAKTNKVVLEVCDNSGMEEEDIKQRIIDLSSIVDMRYTPEVRNYINRYLKYKEGTSLLIGRQMSFFPIFEDVLIKKNLPTDLKYLTIVESGLRPSATSKVGAAGLWQLMRSTGRMLGLKINREVDERRNPFLSTHAATEYLESLYDEFNDWTLALAAYNSGPGRVRSAIRKSGSKDYWELRKFLPRETRNYVPAYIAVTYLSHYYYMHEITPMVEHPDYMSVSNIQLYEKISFKEIEEITGTSIEMLKQMNPGYLRGYIPESEEGQHVLLPNYAATLLLNFLYQPDRNTEDILTVGKDNTLLGQETLVSARKEEKVEALPLLKLSSLLLSDDIPAVLAIEPRRTPVQEIKWYKMTKRESLKDVARKHNIPLSHLIALNTNAHGKLDNNRMIRLK